VSGVGGDIILDSGSGTTAGTISLRANTTVALLVGAGGQVNCGATTAATGITQFAAGDSGTFLHVEPASHVLEWRADSGTAIGAIFHLKHVQGTEADGDYNVIRSTSDDDAGSPNSIITSEIRMIAVDVTTASVDGAVEIWVADTGTLIEMLHAGVSIAGVPVFSVFGATPAAQSADITAFGDTTGGTAGGAIGDVGPAFDQNILNDNLASLAEYVNAWRDDQRSFGFMA